MHAATAEDAVKVLQTFMEESLGEGEYGGYGTMDGWQTTGPVKNVLPDPVPARPTDIHQPTWDGSE